MFACIASTSSINTLVKDNFNISAKESLGQKFTTSNFTETIVVNSESVFGNENVKGGSANSVTVGTNAKKRKVDSGKLTCANSSTEDINK